MKNLVVGIGEALWDVLPEGKKIGGAPANFTYHVSQFGIPSCVVSAIGDDELGREIIDNFNTKGLKQQIAKVPFPTGTVQVEVDAAGIPQYDIKENVAWDNIPYTDELEALAQQTVAVCFGSLAQRNEVSRTTINRFLDAIPQTDETLIVFDINLRQHFYTPEILTESIKRCNILKINDEELITISNIFNLPIDNCKAACQAIIERFDLRMLILTCGTFGSYVFSGEEVSFRPTPKVTVADTVGAGDSFTAAFVASILKGKSISDAHVAAVETSAFVCSQYGAMPKYNR